MGFSEHLYSNPFSIMVEVIPPKGNDLSLLMGEVERWKGRIDAIMVRDLPSAVMRLGALSTAFRLREKGFVPVVEITCRDRNRLALQADLLNASVLGIQDLLVTRGEDIRVGDHPDAKEVGDLNEDELLELVVRMREGSDLAGNRLQGAPQLKAGALVVLSEEGWEKVATEVEKKVERGVAFLVTSPIFTPRLMERFVRSVDKYHLPILASVLLLKSAGMANYINKHVPGISIPDEMIKKLLKSSDRGRTSIELAAALIAELKTFCRGVNLIPLGWENRVPALLDLIKM